MTPYERAQNGRNEIRAAILALLATEQNGLRNSEISARLGLNSGAGGVQKNRMTWELLQGLLQEKKILKSEVAKTYFLG